MPPGSTSPLVIQAPAALCHAQLTLFSSFRFLPNHPLTLQESRISSPSRKEREGVTKRVMTRGDGAPT